MKSPGKYFVSVDGDDGSWERVLWKKQNYPDNFVGKSFFRVQTKGHKVSFEEAFYGSILVTQEICSCVGLVAVFWGISEKQIDTSVVLAMAALSAVLGYLIARLAGLRRWRQGRDGPCLSFFMEDLKVGMFSIVLNWFTSPIIKTLTASVATDTIHACTTGLLVLHLVFHSYGADIAIVNPTISHNLGLFASVCLASRLKHDKDVFSLMIIAVIFFNLLPSFRDFCKESLGKKSIILLTFVQFIMAFSGIYFYAESLCWVFITLVFIVIGFTPILFIYLQPYRKNIYGPWDEALISEQVG